MTLREALHDLDPEQRALIMDHFNNETPFVMPIQDGMAIAVHTDPENHNVIEQAGYWLLIKKEA